MIPKEKPYIVLEGDPKFPATIEYGDAGSVIGSPTFKLFADNFVARSIIFKVKHLRLNVIYIYILNVIHTHTKINSGLSILSL